jgi:predicted dienelactone hydrolase
VTTIIAPDVAERSPLIVLSHGSGGSPDSYTQLATAWAADGFVVAMPRYPLSSSVNEGANASDVVNQPADVSFVITKVLAESAAADTPLSGRVDPEHIGVAGHSLGGATTYGVAYAPCCRDPRIKAVAIFSGVRLVDPGKETFDRPLPTLVFHGTADRTLPYPLGQDAFSLLHAPRWFVTLVDAPHSPPYANEPSKWDQVVQRTTTDFWEAELDGDTAGLAAMLTDANVTGTSSILADPG